MNTLIISDLQMSLNVINLFTICRLCSSVDCLQSSADWEGCIYTDTGREFLPLRIVLASHFTDVNQKWGNESLDFLKKKISNFSRVYFCLSSKFFFLVKSQT